MTTTRELRNALRDTEPAIRGVEVAVIRAKARRVRRRRRVTAALLGCVAAVGAVMLVPHLSLRGMHGTTEAAMPMVDSTADQHRTFGFAAPASQAPPDLPPVDVSGPRVTVGLTGEQLWMAPPIATGRNPQVCMSAGSPGRQLSCQVIEHSVDGSVYQAAIDDGRGTEAQIVVSTAPVVRVRAALDHKSVAASVLPLGSGYVVLRAVFAVGYAKERRCELTGLDSAGQPVVSLVTGVRLSS